MLCGTTQIFGVIAALLVVGCATRLTPDPAVSTSRSIGSTQPGTAIGVISPENTQIRFTGSALFISHEGTFTRFTGRLTCSSSDPKMAKVSAQIEMDSVYTQIPLLTKHLKASDFFDTGKYPLASFVSSQIASATSTDNTHLVTGEFTMHGIAKTIIFPATIEIQPERVHFKANFTIRQTDFGMNASHTTSDQVDIKVDSMVPQN